VNTISPGVVPTEAFGGELGMTEEQVAEQVNNTATLAPMGRVGHPDDIADALVFLVSDASGYSSGIDLVVYGGLTRVFRGKL